MARRNVVVNGLNERLVVNPSPVCESPFSSTSSIGLSADVVPVSNLSDSFTSSPRLSYLRALSGRMVTVGLPPLEPPAQIRSHPVLPFVPGATGSSILPMLRMSESHPTQEGGHKVSSIGIIFTLWNTMMGSTLLVMPYTFQQAGWLLALVLSMLCAVIAQFTCGLILTYDALPDSPIARPPPMLSLPPRSAPPASSAAETFCDLSSKWFFFFSKITQRSAKSQYICHPYTDNSPKPELPTID